MRGISFPNPFASKKAQTAMEQLPNTCELNVKNTHKILVWKQGQTGAEVDAKSWTERGLWVEAKRDSSFRVAKIPITGTDVEILQRDVFPPHEQADYAHYPNQGSHLAFVHLAPRYRKNAWLFIVSKKFPTWTCCKCSHRSQYDASTFRAAKCDGCHLPPCERCRVESKDDLEAGKA